MESKTNIAIVLLAVIAIVSVLNLLMTAKGSLTSNKASADLWECGPLEGTSLEVCESRVITDQGIVRKVFYRSADRTVPTNDQPQFELTE